MKAPAWTAERVDELVAEWGKGGSASQCAKLLCTTRNAVMGKLKRLGKLGTGTKRTIPKPGPRAVRTTKFQPKAVTAPQPLPVEEPAAPGAGIGLMDLTNTTCRWPSGIVGTEDFCYCGKSGADLSGNRPYCRAHMRMRVKR
jgi:GcrA cell cycle regulator